MIRVKVGDKRFEEQQAYRSCTLLVDSYQFHSEFWPMALDIYPTSCDMTNVLNKEHALCPTFHHSKDNFIENWKNSSPPKYQTFFYRRTTHNLVLKHAPLAIEICTNSLMLCFYISLWMILNNSIFCFTDLIINLEYLFSRRFLKRLFHFGLWNCSNCPHSHLGACNFMVFWNCSISEEINCSISIIQ